MHLAVATTWARVPKAKAREPLSSHTEPLASVLPGLGRPLTLDEGVARVLPSLPPSNPKAFIVFSDIIYLI